MNELLAPFLAYAVLMNFTPGPNNILASALGLRRGYRGTLPTLFGMSAGFFAILLCGGLLTDVITRGYERVAPLLSWVGALYMGFLALSLFLHKAGEADGPKEAGGRREAGEGWLAGFLLQFVNPKGLLFAVTTYGSFQTLIAGSIGRSVASALFLAVLCFAAVSTWALAGSALSRLYARPRFRLGFNLVMAALLAWTAVSIVLH